MPMLEIAMPTLGKSGKYNPAKPPGKYDIHISREDIPHQYLRLQGGCPYHFGAPNHGRTRRGEGSGACLNLRALCRAFELMVTPGRRLGMLRRRLKPLGLHYINRSGGGGGYFKARETLTRTSSIEAPERAHGGYVFVVTAW